MKIAALIPLLFLAACVTPEQQRAAYQQQLAQDRSICAQYGYPVGHDLHGQCLMEIQQWRNEQAAAAQGLYQTQMSTGLLLMQMGQPQRLSGPTCVTNYSGGAYWTNCY